MRSRAMCATDLCHTQGADEHSTLAWLHIHVSVRLTLLPAAQMSVRLDAPAQGWVGAPPGRGRALPISHSTCTYHLPLCSWN